MLGERGNIVAEKLCFRKCLPTHRKLAEFAAREAKMFPIKFRNIFLAGTLQCSFPVCRMFPVLCAGRNTKTGWRYVM